MKKHTLLLVFISLSAGSVLSQLPATTTYLSGSKDTYIVKATNTVDTKDPKTNQKINMVSQVDMRLEANYNETKDEKTGGSMYIRKLYATNTMKTNGKVDHTKDSKLPPKYELASEYTKTPLSFFLTARGNISALSGEAFEESFNSIGVANETLDLIYPGCLPAQSHKAGDRWNEIFEEVTKSQGYSGESSTTTVKTYTKINYLKKVDTLGHTCALLYIASDSVRTQMDDATASMAMAFMGGNEPEISFSGLWYIDLATGKTICTKSSTAMKMVIDMTGMAKMMQKEGEEIDLSKFKFSMNKTMSIVASLKE